MALHIHPMYSHRHAGKYDTKGHSTTMNLWCFLHHIISDFWFFFQMFTAMCFYIFALVIWYIILKNTISVWRKRSFLIFSVIIATNIPTCIAQLWRAAFNVPRVHVHVHDGAHNRIHPLLQETCGAQRRCASAWGNWWFCDTYALLLNIRWLIFTTIYACTYY